jgi:hypothetical protein
MFFALLATVLLFSCTRENIEPRPVEQAISASISSNASNRTSITAIPFDKTIFVPCANGGAGEYVHITGSTNLQYTISWTDHGFTYGYHATTYRVDGTGLTSGDTFVGSGNTEGQVMGAWVNEQWLSTFVDQLRLTDANTTFIVKSLYHILVNPDGTTEVKLKDQSADCN